MVIYGICIFINALREKSFFERLAINKRIKKFYRKNKPRVELENDNVKSKLMLDEKMQFFIVLIKKIKVRLLKDILFSPTVLILQKMN